MRKPTVILLFILSIAFFRCNDNHRKKTPSELKMELQRQENENPMQYMKLENVVMTKNKIKNAGLFSKAKYDGYLITGQAINTATMAKFKDLKIAVELYSKTKTVIYNNTFVFYEFYKPNLTKKFSIKIDAPIAMDSFGVFVDGATPSY